MIKAYFSNLSINNTTKKLNKKTYELELQYLRELDSIKAYDIISSTNLELQKGEIIWDLKQKIIIFSYKESNITISSLLTKNINKWRGPIVYTNPEFQGENGYLEFWFH